MVVTTTPSTKKLLKHIVTHFSGYSFSQSAVFAWSSTHKTVHHPTIANLADMWTLLHEIAHAELKHAYFTHDIELLGQEVAAWEHASAVLAPLFGLTIPDDHVQDYLDTYRRWLHERSRCPECQQNGLQTTQNTYNCTNCRCVWRVNDARDCQLRRVRLQGQAVHE
jgi:hypothetical protein